MEWKGALRNAESRLNVLQFIQREELEALQLTSKKWRRNVDRYSPELALRRIKHVTVDLKWSVTFYFGRTGYPKHRIDIVDRTFCTDDFGGEEVDCHSPEFDAKVANFVSVAKEASQSTRINNCFIEWMCLLADDGERPMDFDANFCVWIKALQQLEADVRVQTLEVLDPYYKMGMEAAYRQLRGAFNVQEYVISYENIEMGYEGQGEELCADVVKKAKRIGILEYHLNFGYDDDEAEDDKDEDNAAMDDKPEINGFKKNVLDFVFNASECEELYVTVEGDGSGLIKKLIRRFQRLQSTSQMVSTFTWKWGINYEGDTWERNDCAKPIAKGHANPFKDVTLECRRRQCFPEPNDTVPEIGQLSGDVYEFRNENDGTHLTVVIADAYATVQFRKGRFELAEAAAQCSPEKKLRLGNNHTE